MHIKNLHNTSVRDVLDFLAVSVCTLNPELKAEALKSDPGGPSIEFKVNGIEINFMNVLTDVYSRMRVSAKENAQRDIERMVAQALRTEDVMAKLVEMEEELLSLVRTNLRNLNLDFKDE